MGVDGRLDLYYPIDVSQMGYDSEVSMAKTEMIRARIEPGLKKEVSSIFEAIGLSTTEAITLFYKMVRLNKGLPFEIKIPNELTRKVMQATDEGRDLVEWNRVDDFLDEMGT